MSRPCYTLDTDNVAYERVGPMTFQFRGPPALVSIFKNRNAVVQSKNSGFKIVSFEVLPGPPVNGDLLYKFKLERFV